MGDFYSRLTRALEKNGYQLPAPVIEKLAAYLELLRTWNQTFNLTAITDPEEMVYLHIIDSLSLAPYLVGSRMLDVGSGAGLPGIPLALAYPGKEWTLLDKNNKKTRFLTQAVAELGLEKVQIVKSTGEEFHPGQCFDSILSRALGTIEMFVRMTEHLLCPQGVILAMKGKYPEEELREIPERFRVEQVARLWLKDMTIERHIVCLRKTH